MVHVEPRCENGSVGLHVEGPNQASPQDAVVLSTLSYAYSGHQPIISDISLTLPKGSRCLLLGANGAGEPLRPCATSHLTTMICSQGMGVRHSEHRPLMHCCTDVSKNNPRAAAASCWRQLRKCTCFHVSCICITCFLDILVALHCTSMAHPSPSFCTHLLR